MVCVINIQNKLSNLAIHLHLPLLHDGNLTPIYLNIHLKFT